MRKYFYTFTAILLLIFANSCTKNDDTTFILIGEESNVPDFNIQCSKNLQNAMMFHGYDIQDTLGRYLIKTMTPPNVEGKYKVQRVNFIETTEIWYSNIYPVVMHNMMQDLNRLNDSIYVTFSKQHNCSVHVDYQWLSCGETKYGISTDAYVIGGVTAKYDTIFAVYFDCIKDNTNSALGDDVSASNKRGELVTGKIKKEGIYDFRFSSISKDRQGVDSLIMPAKDEYFVIKDGGINAENPLGVLTKRID